MKNIVAIAAILFLLSRLKNKQPGANTVRPGDAPIKLPGADIPPPVKLPQGDVPTFDEPVVNDVPPPIKNPIDIFISPPIKIPVEPPPPIYEEPEPTGEPGLDEPTIKYSYPVEPPPPPPRYEEPSGEPVDEPVYTNYYGTGGGKGIVITDFSKR